MKRLIVCCDGTWLDSQSGLMQGKIPIPSNVTRLSQAIRTISRDGIPQVVFYQAGIGSQGGILNRVIGGATADGLSENIRSGYAFLSNNYHKGDEIFFFGFSRGAFTARSIAGMIEGVGLLTKDGLPFLAEIFKDWENARNDNYRPKNPDIPFPDKPSAGDPRYRKLLAKKHLSRFDIQIQVVGVFDTVGSLGIPRIPWLERFHLQTRSTKEYLFFDTKLNDHIIHAFQALALDEHRSAFSPAVWEKPKECQTHLRQVWFPGVHSNIGGGYPDQGMANITLAWMMAQVGSMLDFDDTYILDEFEATLDHYEQTDQKPRPWSFGKIYRSLTGIYVLGGRLTRTPGDYFEVDPYSGRETDVPLLDTNEYIHPSVRTRKVKRGPGVEDMGTYDGHPLDAYKLRAPNAERRVAIWDPRSRRSGLHSLPESPLWGMERELLAEDSRTYEYLLGDGGGGGSSHRPSGPADSQLVPSTLSRSRRDSRSPMPTDRF